MQKYLLIALAAAIASGATATAQQLKFGTVDMKKVFESYYKTKEAEAKINEARANAKKELDDRIDLQKKAADEIQKLDAEVNNAALSAEAKGAKTKVRDEKIAEYRTMQRENDDFRQNREKQLNEQSARMRAGIVEEINKVVDARVKAENYDFVLDKSGPSLNGVPVVLFARESLDFTTDVVTALNKTRGEAPAPEPATPKASPATPKAAATPKKQP